MTTEIKLILVGDSGCGKTSLLFRLCKNYFPDSEQLSSPFETENAVLTVNGEKVELMICDTGGGTVFDSLRKLSYEDGDVILICYSIVDRKSLENVLEKWKPELDQNTTSERPVLLVGNKKDEREPDLSYRNIRNKSNLTDQAVSTFEGRDVENRIAAQEFLECSAKTGENVTEVFQRAAEIGLKYSRTRKKKTCRQS